MLHRSFKPAKCKTALKLAGSRMKLLKNKREAQLKQLKKELAQLLQSGQDRTAMIRVEHVVREEKTLAAYELIEVYCELIVARLPIIESQKNCPIDLKEAIASVVFASPRCVDVPELMDVRKHFTAKYGKEFVSAAVALRPDCGVGRMLIDKLSVKAPDGPTKIKILKSIAEEHNIKWDPSAESDSKPPEDLLNGPSNFEKASQMHMDPHSVQVRPDYHSKGQTMFQVPASHGEKSDRSSGQNYQSNTPTDRATNTATTSGTSHEETRPPGNGNEGIGVMHSHSGNSPDLSSGRQNWNMEFKDAAEAARAAAESADRASMAARAAAEFSSHVNVTGLNFPESRGSYGVRGDPPGRYSSSNFEDEHVAKDQAVNAFHGRVPEKSNETEQDDMTGEVDERFHKHDNRSTDKPNQPSSLNPQASSFDDDVDDHMVNSSQMEDVCSENNSSRPGRSDFTGQVSFDKPSSEAGYESEHDDMKFEKQPSRTSSRSHSRTLSNDHDAGSDPNNDDYENPFVVINEGNFRNDTEQTSSHDKAPLVFDESGSDDEEDGFDPVRSEGQESSLFFSAGEKSPTHLSANINAWSPRQNVPHPVFSESSSVASQSVDLLPVVFDDADGPTSESEEELETSRHVRTMEVTIVSKHNHSFLEEEPESDGELFSQSFSNDTDSPEVHSYGHPGTESSSRFQEKSGSSDFPSKLKELQVVSDDDSSHPSVDPVVGGDDNFHPSKVSDNTIRDTEVIEEESSLESGSELRLGKLTGGLRNKGYRLPPYNRNPSGNSFSSKQTVEDTSSKVSQSSSPPRAKITIGSGASGLQESHNQNTRRKENEKPTSRASNAQLDYNPEAENNMSFAVNQTSSSSIPPTYFDSNDSDSGDNLPKHSIGVGFSRRTKAYPEQSDKQATPERNAERIETPTEPHSETKSSFHIGDLDWARKAVEPVSKPIQDPYRPSPKERKVSDSIRPSPKERKLAEPVSKSSPEERKATKPASRPFPGEESSKPAGREQPSSSLPKGVLSGSSGSMEKPSHVHPNLPDIDDLTAHLQSLRR